MEAVFRAAEIVDDSAACGGLCWPFTSMIAELLRRNTFMEALTKALTESVIW